MSDLHAAWYALSAHCESDAHAAGGLGPNPNPNPNPNQVDLVYQRCTAVNLQSRAKDFNTGKAISAASLTLTPTLIPIPTPTLTLSRLC